MLSMLAVFMPQAQALSWEQSAAKSLVLSEESTQVLNAKLPEAYYEKRELYKNKLKLDRKSPHTAKPEQHSSDESHVAAVPEPETYAMMLTGLGLLVVTLSGRNRQHFN